LGAGSPGRSPGATARVGTVSVRRFQLALAIGERPQNAKLTSTSRWLAPEAMAVGKADLREQDLKETLEPIRRVVAPAANSSRRALALEAHHSHRGRSGSAWLTCGTFAP
jgi:hypothetical protein